MLRVALSAALNEAQHVSSLAALGSGRCMGAAAR